MQNENLKDVPSGWTRHDYYPEGTYIRKEVISPKDWDDPHLEIRVDEEKGGESPLHFLLLQGPGAQRFYLDIAETERLIADLQQAVNHARQTI